MDTGLFKESKGPQQTLVLETLSIPSAHCFVPAEIFLRGLSAVFALALHERFGFSIYFATAPGEDEDKVIHAFCRNKDTQELYDVRGCTQSIHVLLKLFDGANIRHAVPRTAEQCEELIATLAPSSAIKAYRKAAHAYIDRHLDYFQPGQN